MYLGIDLGTSSLKAVLVGGDGAIVAQAGAPLTLSSPRAQWNEQDPEAWWAALLAALGDLRAEHDLSGVRAIGLCGQMHGAVLLDDADRVLRPAILWNDGRAQAECAELEATELRSAAITGNRAMPGFTAPKLLWVRRHEPDIFARTARVLLPKDWLRLRLTGEVVSEMSDAAGTLWLDVGRRRWSDAMLSATGLTERHMPSLVEGSALSGRLRPVVAALLGLPVGCPVAGGAGDNAAGAVGLGCIAPGQAFLSLGTSGVIFTADAAFMPDPDRMVHAFCHALPNAWHRMSVILSAAASLSWIAASTGTDEATLLREIAAAPVAPRERLVFLPYLSGERTPHNDAAAAGVFFGLNTGHGRAAMGRAVLEGVGFGLGDGLDALEAGGGRIDALTVIGGGSRGALWLRILSTILHRRLSVVEGGDVRPALGAARLAMLAVNAGDARSVCSTPAEREVFEPDPALAEGLMFRRSVFRRLYPALRPIFAASVEAI